MKINNPLKTLIPKHLNLEDIIRKIERKYRERLVHKGTWIGKTAMLDVVVSAPLFRDTSNGVTFREYIDNEVRYTIRLHINFKDSTRYIAYVIAHEFAHLLFADFHDHLGCHDLYSEIKDHGSSIRCRIPDTFEHYGYGMEEAAANLAAAYILSHCRFPDENGTFDTELEEKMKLASIAGRFAEFFGEPLDTLSYFDEFKEEEIRVHEGNPEYEELKDTHNLTTDPITGEKYGSYYTTVVENLFWYAATTCSFKSIIRKYEAYMGNDSYRELCRDLDYFYDHHHELTPPPPHIIKARIEAEERRKRIEQSDNENLRELLKMGNSSENPVPEDPETIREAYRRAMAALDRFEELYNAPPRRRMNPKIRRSIPRNKIKSALKIPSAH